MLKLSRIPHNTVFGALLRAVAQSPAAARDSKRLRTTLWVTCQRAKRLLGCTVSINEICSDPAVATPDLIKFDVEGAQSAVLEGARRTLALSHPIILLATHGPDQERTGYELTNLDGVPIMDA